MYNLEDAVMGVILPFWHIHVHVRKKIIKYYNLYNKACQITELNMEIIH